MTFMQELKNGNFVL